jgi:ABC-type uncharacterized transport system substrate-binding protein
MSSRPVSVQFRNLLRALTWCLASCCAAHAAAAESPVTFVMSGETGVYAEIRGAIERELDHAGVAATRRTVLSVGAWSPGNGVATALTVTVGYEATEKVLAAGAGTPVYAALIPELSYRALRPAGRAVLYLDQPLERQMGLIRLALPRAQRIAVVLGPESSVLRERLQRAAEAAGLTLHIERAERPDDLNDAVTRALGDSDILLAIPDEQIFNRNTAHNVLLTAYRLRKPVAGYSQAYVRAGALFAVYSTPSQIGRQIGMNVARALGKPPASLPSAQYPREYEVATNERVARSLGIALAPADRLAARLREGGQ